MYLTSWGIYPGLAAGPMVLALMVLVPLGWLAARALRGSAELGAAAGAALAVTVVATIARPGLRSASADPALLSSCLVTDPTFATRDARLNLLLMIPFAVLATLAVGRPLVIATMAMLASAGIETVQATFGVGACDSSDLLHNTLGAVGAALLAAALRAVFLAVVAWIDAGPPPPARPPVIADPARTSYATAPLPEQQRRSSEMSHNPR